MQAEEEAAVKRKIAIQQANNAISEQIRSIREALEMERARLEGTEATTAAAQAYARAIRSGADATHAAALSAAVLEDHMERAQIAAERMANEVGRASLGGDLGAKLSRIGTGTLPSFSAGTGFARPGDVAHTRSGGGPLLLARQE